MAAMRAIVVAVAAFVAFVVAGCYGPSYQDCEVGCTEGECPSGLTCDVNQRCRAPEMIGQACAPPDLPNCNNGVLDEGEDCEDGNTINTDACVGCRFARCGDGQIRAGIEECDDSNLNNNDTCTTRCWTCDYLAPGPTPMAFSRVLKSTSGRCYWATANTVTWTNGRTACESEALAAALDRPIPLGVLATIDTQAIGAELGGFLTTKGLTTEDLSPWIGLTDETIPELDAEETRFQWLTGPFDTGGYMPWTGGPPMTADDPHDFVTMAADTMWNVLTDGGQPSTGGNRNGLCERREPFFVPQEPSQRAYYVFDRPKPWLTARQDCIQIGGHLAAPSTELADLALASRIPTSYVQGVWLGGSEPTDDGNIVWENGDSFSYFNWTTGAEPTTGTLECVQGTSQGAWRAEPCTDAKPYICELQ